MNRRYLAISQYLSFFLIIIFVLLFGLITNNYAKNVRGVTDTTIKLGVIGDLTGPAASVWKPIAEGVRMYYRYINDQGGIHDRKIKYFLEDDRYSIPMALAAFKKLVFRDEVLSLTPGASGAGHTHALIPLCEKHKIPLSAATNNKDFFQPVRKYIFTTLPFYSDQIELILDYLMIDRKIKRPRIALAYPDSAAGKDVRDSTKEEMKARGIKIIDEVIIPMMGGDCTSQVLTLKRKNPKFIIMYGVIGNTVSLLRDGMKLGFSPTIFVTQYGCVDDTVKIAGNAAKNMMGANGFGSWHDQSTAMIKLRKITLGYTPGSGSRNRNYMQGWLMAMIAVEGIRNAGKNLNASSLIKGLEMIKGYDTQGICGIVNYGPEDHKAVDYHRIYKADVVKKIVVPITGWRQAPKAKVASR
ncbi:MAG: ABC transporter substrate-binding protein [Spirochaetota bacterium]|nr:ABC transporter substrate-binding protein [Spirochaetota bacterium]